ncbi:hypothetical protein [Nostoc sp.]
MIRFTPYLDHQESEKCLSEPYWVGTLIITTTWRWRFRKTVAWL